MRLTPAGSDRSEDPGPALLWSDAHLLAVAKPAGLLVHRTRLALGETASVLDALRRRLGGTLFPLHRLDRPTSGLLLFARSVEAARAFGALLAAGAVEKRYLAVVRGWPADRGVIEHPLREEHDPVAEPRARPDKPAREARTDFSRLATVELPHAVGRYASARYALVEARPLTGRRHQIRRHFAHISHPVLGDTTHGDGRQNRFCREGLACRRLLLAATGVDFTHPLTGEPLSLRAPLEADYAALVERLGWAEAVARALAPVRPG